jgi:hypothetical protein
MPLSARWTTRRRNGTLPRPVTTQADEINRKLDTLAVVAPMTLHWTWDFFWAKGQEQQGAFRTLTENVDGVRLLGDSLGLAATPRWLFTASMVGGLTTVLLNNCVRDTTLGGFVRDTYGQSAGLRFIFVELAAIVSLSAGFVKLGLRRNVPNPRSKHWREELAAAAELYSGFAQSIRSREHDCRHIFGREATRGFSRLASALLQQTRLSQSRCAAIERAAHDVLMGLVPHTTGIEERRETARELLDDLQTCRPGPADWRKYEDLCVRILRFCFVPPFRTLTIQASTESRGERRDIILSNNQHAGFWASIREEFASRHVVCESKNARGGGSKADLNQLRVYLSKRTVGRFGLLFVRTPPSKALLRAQRDAYEESGIFIVILDDKLVEQLLLARVFLGIVDDVLERAKIEFEVTF